MNNNENKISSGRGGARPGAGRKKGSKSSKNTTVFYAKCTQEEKKKLSDYLKQIRALIVVFILCFFISPVSAQTVITNNAPNDIQISISKTKNSFQVDDVENTISF